MSFSTQVKNELVKTEYERSCCKRALLYGLSLFGKSFSESSVSLQTENEPTARLFQSLLKEIFNMDARVDVSPRGRNFTASVYSEVLGRRVSEALRSITRISGVRIAERRFLQAFSLPAARFRIRKKIIIWSFPCRITTCPKACSRFCRKWNSAPSTQTERAIMLSILRRVNPLKTACI